MNLTGLVGQLSCADAGAAESPDAKTNKLKSSFMGKSYLQVRSMRFASGEEVLIACVITEEGRVGYGISLNLDATEARHMAERAVGLQAREPR